MEKFTREDVINYADKLLIGLTDDEVEMVLSEMDIIDKNIDIINNIPGIKEASCMTHALDDFSFELREDVASESVSIDDLLSNCDDTYDRSVRVPKVVE